MVPFAKMNGLGNDLVVIRHAGFGAAPEAVTPVAAIKLAGGGGGGGQDQLRTRSRRA